MPQHRKQQQRYIVPALCGFSDMKKIHTLVMLSLGLLGSTAIHAADTAESDYVATAKKGPGIPVPVSVVAPEVRFAEAGAAAEVVLVVDPAGRPVDVAVKSTTDKALGYAAREAVKKWRFEPAMVDGKPAAVKVLVPFTVAETAGSSPVFAANR